MARRPTVHDVVNSRKAPKPIGPYVQAIHVKQPGETLYISGQIPLDAKTGQVFTGDIKRQAEMAFAHLRNIITDAKFSMDEVVKVTIYLKEMKDFEVVNTVYQRNFIGQSLPARAVVQVAGLPKDVGIEVDAIAVKKGSGEAAFSDDDFR